LHAGRSVGMAENTQAKKIDAAFSARSRERRD
jgi:hypothetical protein